MARARSNTVIQGSEDFDPSSASLILDVNLESMQSQQKESH